MNDSPLSLPRLAVPGLGLVLAMFLFLCCTDDAFARAIRIDDTLQRVELNVAAEVHNDGSTGPLPIQSYVLDDVTGQPDYSAPLPFTMNLFGSVYSEFYINENGSISFGAAFSGRPGNSDLANTGMPILAPFFADVDMSLSGAVFNGFFPFQNAIAITWTGASYLGQTDGSTQSFQIVIRDRSGDTGVAGDFDLEFNYSGNLSTDGMAWESGDLDGGVNGLGGQSARVGFYDGFGAGYEIAGSGVNGALLGPADSFLCSSFPLRLECNDYDFQFRGGIPFQDGAPLVPTAVPEPDTLTLLMVLMGGMALARRLRWPLRAC